MYLATSFPFFLGGLLPSEDANGCWIGAPSVFEQNMLKTLSVAALEQLRLRLLFAVTTSHDPVQGARAMLQMAFETEAGVVLVKLMTPPPDLEAHKVCPRRRYLDVDSDMRSYGFLVDPAISGLAQLPTPALDPYVQLLRRQVASNYPRYRVSALAAVVCMAVALS